MYCFHASYFRPFLLPLSMVTEAFTRFTFLVLKWGTPASGCTWCVIVIPQPVDFCSLVNVPGSILLFARVTCWCNCVLSWTARGFARIQYPFKWAKPEFARWADKIPCIPGRLVGIKLCPETAANKSFLLCPKASGFNIASIAWTDIGGLLAGGTILCIFA